MKNQTLPSEKGYVMTDYSRKTSWYQIPDAAREVDTIYIYATEYIMGSFEEGSPDYATLDNEEMVQGVAGEYMMHASAFADATNVFVPYYRQAGLRYDNRSPGLLLRELQRGASVYHRGPQPGLVHGPAPAE